MERAHSLTFVVISVLVICQQAQGDMCPILNTFLLLNTTEGAMFTYQSSLYKNPQTVIFHDEHVPQECGPNFQLCNITIVEQNQRVVALIPLIRGAGLLLYNHSTNVLQLLEKHVLPIPENFQCYMTSMFKLRARRYVLGHCLNLMEARNMNIRHLELSINFTNIASSVWYESDERYPPEDLYAPDSFSGFVYAPDTSCASGDPYHIYSVDDGYVLDFRKEFSSNKFIYDPYCINHQDCQLVTKLVYVTRERLAVYCAGGLTVLYDTCSTPTITETKSVLCSVYKLSLKEVSVFDTLVNGTPYFCSPDAYVLDKNNTITLVQNEISDWTILLPIPPTDPIINAMCSNFDNEIFFLSYHQSGETYLTRVNENTTNLIGRGTLERNIPPKIYHQRYTVVNNDSASLVYDLSCMEPRVQIAHPYHLAVVVEASSTQKCECGTDETTEASAELPTNGTDATETLNATTETPTTEIPSVTTETPSVTMETPSVTMETPSATIETPSVTTETPATTTETPTATVKTSGSTQATTGMNIDIPGELQSGTTIGIVSIAMLLCLVVVMVVIGFSAYVCVYRKRGTVRHHDIISPNPPHVRMREVREPSEEVIPTSSPIQSSSQQADRRVSLVFGRDLQGLSDILPHTTAQGTIELELPPQDIPPSTPRPTEGNTGLELPPQGPQNTSPLTPHLTGGAIGLELHPQSPQDVQPSTPHLTGGAIGLELPPQSPQDVQPSTAHLTGGAIGLELPPQSPQDVQPFTPHLTGGAIGLELPPQSPQDVQPSTAHLTGGAIGLELPPQSPQDVQPFTPHLTGGAIGLELPPQSPQDVQPFTPHLTGGAIGLELPPQSSQDVQPSTPYATEDASEREQLIQEIRENLPVVLSEGCTSNVTPVPVACSDPAHPGQYVNGHQMPLLHVTTPQVQVSDTDNNDIILRDINEDR